MLRCRPTAAARSNRGRARGGPLAVRGGRFGRRGGARFPTDYAPIVVNERQVGVVAVPSNPPPRVGRAARAGSDADLVRPGAARRRRDADGALRCSGPAHKRLRTLEQAARALGEGRTDVRATEAGGDEVSSLARTFNRMAADLDSRADGARRVRSRATPAARRRLARADDAAVGDPRLRRDARHGGRAARRRHAPALSRASSSRRRTSSKRSSATCSISRGSKAAATRLARRSRSRSTICSRASPIGISRRCASAASRSTSTSRRTRRDILGDAARLEQALQNLAANAIRHTPSTAAG